MREIGLKDLIEMKILSAVQGLLVGRVNEFLQEMEFAVPAIEFGEYASGSVVVPVVGLVSCERSEKERIVRVEVYNLTISFSLPESSESELHCYAIAAAVEKALCEDCTLGGIADRAVLAGKKYMPPKVSQYGGNWEVVLTVKITVEQIAMSSEEKKYVG